jgi:hypothetical protein
MMNRTQFLSHFVWRAQEDFSYLPPADGAVEETQAATEGLWGGNWKKNERIARVAALPPEQRAKHIVVAMQVLAWLQEMERWTNDRMPRCQLARNAAGWTVNLVGKFKGYPPAELSALTHASAGCRSMDGGEMASRAKVLHVLASHSKEIPRDAGTRAALGKFVENVLQEKSLSQAVQKAIDKLTAIASGQEAEPKKSGEKQNAKAKPTDRKAIQDSEVFWELPGESELRAATIPDPPQPKKPTIVRLTHTNYCGPFAEARFFVRARDPENSREEDDDSAGSWTACNLVEELVHVDGQDLPRSQAKEPFADEVVWYGTYEATLKMPAGASSVEIKVVSEHPELPYSVVLSDWDVAVE